MLPPLSPLSIGVGCRCSCQRIVTLRIRRRAHSWQVVGCICRGGGRRESMRLSVDRPLAQCLRFRTRSNRSHQKLSQHVMAALCAMWCSCNCYPARIVLGLALRLDFLSRHAQSVLSGNELGLEPLHLHAQYRRSSPSDRLQLVRTVISGCQPAIAAVGWYGGQ